MIKNVKVIPDLVKIGSQLVKVEKSSKGFIRINGIVSEIKRDDLRYDNENWEELMYQTFERCLEEARKKGVR